MPHGDFLTIFLKQIKPGNHVLDLGAGDGEFSRMFADRGAIVTAVDSKSNAKSEGVVINKHLKVEDFVTQDSSKYDLVFMRNILQFLDKQWVFDVLFPWIENHLNIDGIVGVETFYQEPVRPFDHPLQSLYTTQELTSHFLTWQEIYVKQYDHRGPDMSGRTRHFFIIDFLIKKIHKEL